MTQRRPNRIVRSARRLARRSLQRLPEPAQRRTRHLRARLGRHPQLSVGVLSGDSLWTLQAASPILAPVMTAAWITDARAAFVADPFAMRTGEGWFLFFEVLNRANGRGEIACAGSPDLVSWDYLGRVLVEPFHLSYPHVFAVDGEVFMTPESWESGQVRLYRATDFPRGWTLDTILLEGVIAIDPTPFQTAGRWWLLCESDPEHRYDTLRLYSSPSLRGPWAEHATSPLVEGDPTAARPAGRVVQVDGALYRMAQDCSEHYGESVSAFRLDVVDGVPTDGREQVELLTPGPSGWNRSGMHHIDAHQDDAGRWIAFVDGQA